MEAVENRVLSNHPVPFVTSGGPGSRRTTVSPGTGEAWFAVRTRPRSAHDSRADEWGGRSLPRHDREACILLPGCVLFLFL
jgi:hypothetical protein